MSSYAPPVVSAEARANAIARWEANGWLDPLCKGCEDFYAAMDRMPDQVWAPRHQASFGCESGMRPHCTCDSCW